MSWPGWLHAGAVVIAADGGWYKARTLALDPAVLVGDADSLPPAAFDEAAAAGVETRRVAAMKEESDTELAVGRALAAGARHVTILGALGGRLDHTLANLGLLALPAPGEATIELLDGRTRVRLLRAPATASGRAAAGRAAAATGRVAAATGRAAAATGGATPDAASCSLAGPIGDIVSLLALGADADGVTTAGLLYPLRDEPLPQGPARGLSNVRISQDASVSLRAGQLLIVETHPDGPPSAKKGEQP